MEIHQPFSETGDEVTNVTATLPITSTGGTTPNISSSLAQNKLLGRGATSGTGVFQAITLGTNISLTGTTLNAAGSITGTGAVNRNAFWLSSSQISYDNNNVWDNTNKRLGLGITSPSYRLDDTAPTITLADPSVFTAILTLESKDPPPNIGTGATLIYGPFPVTFGTGTEIGAGGAVPNYNNNDSVQAYVYAYRTIDGINYVSSSYDLGTVNLVSNPAAIQWAWSSSTLGDGGAVSGYFLVINNSTMSTSYSWDVGSALSFDDYNVSNTAAATQPFNGFAAMGQTYNYDFYSKATSPTGGLYYSNANTTSAFDSFNNGSHFWVSFSWTPTGSDDTKIITSYGVSNTFTSATSQTYDVGTWSGDTVNSPQHYGIQSDSATLNRDYQLYSYDSSVPIFSASYLTSSTVDPGDSNYYYFVYTYTTPSGGAKGLETINGGGTTGRGAIAASPFYQDALGGAFSEGTAVAPSSSTATAGRFTNAGDTSYLIPALIVNSTSDRPAVDFTTSGTRKAGISYTSTYGQRFDGSSFTFAPDTGHNLIIDFFDTPSAGNRIANMDGYGRLALGQTGTPTAKIHLGAGSTASGTAPAKIISGTVMTTPEAGAVEYDGTQLYFSPSTTRHALIQDNGSRLTSTKIPVATTSGFLIDSGITDTGSAVTIASATLFQNGLSLSSGKDIAMGTGGKYTGGILTTFSNKTASFTFNQANNSPWVYLTGTTAAQTATLPTAVGVTGVEYGLKNDTNQNWTLATTSSQTIFDNTATTTKTIKPGDFIMCKSDGANWVATYYSLTLTANTWTGQQIFNTSAAKFGVGMISPKWYPASDSTTALQMLKTDGTTVLFNVDTTNSRFMLNNPTYVTNVFNMAIGNAASTANGMTLESSNTSGWGGGITFRGTSGGNTYDYVRYSADNSGVHILTANASRVLTEVFAINSSGGTIITSSGTTGLIVHTSSGSSYIAKYFDDTYSSSATPVMSYYGDDTGFFRFEGATEVHFGAGYAATGQDRMRVGVQGTGGGILTLGSPGGASAPTSNTRTNEYLHVGANYGVNSYKMIGFGYSTGSGSESPCFFGMFETSEAGNTKGDLIWGTRSVTTNTAATERMRLFTTGDLSIGTATDYARLAVLSTTEQIRAMYDATNYFSTTVGSAGSTTFALTGTSPLFTFSQGIINSTLTASKLVLTDGSKQLVSGTAANLSAAGIPTVTNVSLTAQGADIAATNLATVAGLYLVSYSLQDTTADITAGAVILTLSYTDGAGAATATATQTLVGVGRQSGSVYVQLASGNLTYATTHTGIFGTAVYALYITTQRVL